MTVLYPIRIEHFRTVRRHNNLHLLACMTQEIEYCADSAWMYRGLRLFNRQKRRRRPLINRGQKTQRTQCSIGHIKGLKPQALIIAPFLSKFERELIAMLLCMNSLRIWYDR